MSLYDHIETISPKNMTPLTQVERIIVHMFMHPERVWWFAGDFMQPRLANDHPHYVGYEASARLTDALTKYCEEGKTPLFATERQDKFRVVRVKWDTFEQALKDYPALIRLAERTDIMRRFAGLAETIEQYRPAPKPAAKKKFKSYA